MGTVEVYFLGFLAIISWESSTIHGTTIPVIIHRHHTLSLIQIDPDHQNVSSIKTIVTGIDEPPISIAINVQEDLGIYIDTLSKASEDYFQIFSISNASHFRRFSRYVGVAEDSITSLAYDWITNKLYLAIETTGIRNLGRIEACPLDGTACAVLLQNELDTVHSLVVDPVNGYMYWLNKIQKRIERAWLNGKHLERHPFHEDLPPENISVTTGLTLDIPSWHLYFIRTRTFHTQSEIVACEFYNRTSCKVVIDNIRAYHMNVYGDYLFWTSIDGSHEGIRFCHKEKCRKTMGVLANTTSVDVFRVFHADVQPERTHPNPCFINNGDCSHLCLLTPGAPWRSCSCPVGVKLLHDDLTCEPKGVEKALFVSAASGLFYISLDTDDYIPQPITYPGYDRETNIMQKIVDVEYDPVEEMVYWMDQEMHRIRKSRLNGSDFEDFITDDLNKTIDSLSIDPYSRNLYWIDSKHGRIEVARMDKPNSFRKTILSTNMKKIKGLTLDLTHKFLYYSISGEEETVIERASMDGSNRSQIISIPARNLLTDIVLDPENEMLYWSEAQESKIYGVNMNDGSKTVVVAQDLINPHSISKLGSTIFVNSFQGRTLTAIRLPTINPIGQKNIGSTLPPHASLREISDSVIYGQTSLKAAYLHQRQAEKENSEKNLCAEKNGGCQHICVPMPDNKRRCLCSTGYELQLGGTKCDRPASFLIYSQLTITDDLLRISTRKFLANNQRINIANISTTPQAIAVDPTRGLVYFVTEHPHRHEKTYGTIRRAFLNGTGSELVVESRTLRNVVGMAVEWVSGNVYICNGYLKRIEVCSPNTGSCKTILWKKINPRFIVVHPIIKKIFYADFHKHGVNIMASSLNGSKENSEILIRDVGEVTGMGIDTKTNKIYWSTYNGQGGTLSVANTEGLNREQLMAEKHLFPTSLTFSNNKLYFANKATNAIETYENEKYGVLHENVQKIQSLAAAYVSELEEFNPCGFSNMNNRQCICLPTSLIGSECGCQDQYEYDSNEKKCLAPKKFLLVASKDRFIRYKIRQTAFIEHSFEEDPFVILPITNIGLPTALTFDSISAKRFIYWIDVQDGSSGTIKRASDVTKGNAKSIFLGTESNCTQIFDMVVDELGRQLFVSCAHKDFDYVAFIHVWKIREDDNLRYIGRVVAGDKKSMATDSYPSPRQIAVFNRLDALFYVDHSRVRDSPVIVRCKLNGKDCELVVSQGLSFTGTRLYADLTTSRLIYTASTGVWSRDVYVDHDVKRHLVISPNRNINIAPVDEKIMLVVASNDSVLGLNSRHEDRILELQYNLSSQTLNQLKSASSWTASADIMRRISAVMVVGTYGYDSTPHKPHIGSYSSLIELSCIRSDCSHMCRIPYDTAAIKENYECLCPVDYRKDDDSETQCVRNVGCSRWQFACDNGKECIHMAYKCDGVKDCSDNSDESFAICGAHATLGGIGYTNDGSRWSLQNWTCDDRSTTIPKHLFCNGHWDCEDGSDEQYCQCMNPANYFDCSAWKKSNVDYFPYGYEEEDCISRVNLCDGIVQCRNKVDEEEKLCTMLAMTPYSSLISMFDFRTWTGYAIVLVFVVLALVIIIPICCCCYMYRRNTSKPGYGINTSTLPSTHHTMLSGSSQPTHAEARLLLPTTGSGAQVELSMRTYPQNVETSDGYNTLPAMRSHFSASQPPYHHHHQVVFHDGTNRSYVTAVDSNLYGPYYQYNNDVCRRFHAPPPSAASLSTYGIVKPAGMRMMQTPRSNHERRTMPRRVRRNTSQNSSRQLHEIEQREYLIDFFPPPSYSEVGSAVKCSTPISAYRKTRRNLSADIPETSRRIPNDDSDTATSSDATRELKKHIHPKARRKEVPAVPTNSRNPSSEESISKIGVGEVPNVTNSTIVQENSLQNSIDPSPTATSSSGIGKN